jgi:hypothetical protein
MKVSFIANVICVDVNAILPIMIPLDVHHQSNILARGWFQPSLTNAAFMHSILCSAALHLCILGQGSFEEVLEHKMQAVTAVNANFLDASLGIGDANIAAVFTLLCVEESLLLPIFEQYIEQHHGTPSQRLIHLNGLCRMLQLRGGLGQIYTSRCLQALITW